MQEPLVRRALFGIGSSAHVWQIPDLQGGSTRAGMMSELNTGWKQIRRSHRETEARSQGPSHMSHIFRCLPLLRDHVLCLSTSALLLRLVLQIFRYPLRVQEHPCAVTVPKQARILQARLTQFLLTVCMIWAAMMMPAWLPPYESMLVRRPQGCHVAKPK